MTDDSWLPRDGTHYSLYSVLIFYLEGQTFFRVEWVPTFPDKIKKALFLRIKGKLTFKTKFFLIGSEVRVIKEAKNQSLSMNFFF